MGAREIILNSETVDLIQSAARKFKYKISELKIIRFGNIAVCEKYKGITMMCRPRWVYVVRQSIVQINMTRCIYKQVIYYKLFIMYTGQPYYSGGSQSQIINFSFLSQLILLMLLYVQREKTQRIKFKVQNIFI